MRMVETSVQFDFTPVEWDRINQVMGFRRKNIHDQFGRLWFAQCATEIKLIGGDPKVTDEERVLLFSELESYRMRSAQDDFVTLGASLRILYPDLPLPIDEQQWNKIHAWFAEERKETAAWGLARVAALTRIIDASKTPKIDEGFWPQLNGQFSVYKKEPSRYLDSFRHPMYMMMLAAKDIVVTEKGVQIIMPEKAQIEKSDTQPAALEL